MKSKNFSRILLVVPEKQEPFYKEILQNYPCEEKNIQIIHGGKERFQSVKNALHFLENNMEITENEKVLIHDTARPLLKEEYLIQILKELGKFEAVTLGYKITDALKKASASGIIEKNVDRDFLWAVTTPQGFKLKKLIDLYHAQSQFLYDETSLFTLNNFSAKIIDQGRYNIKVTYPLDLEIVTKLIN